LKHRTLPLISGGDITENQRRLESVQMPPTAQTFKQTPKAEQAKPDQMTLDG
jgi:hypothetical protein